jgi:predicted ribosome quality control (RQC) complex YloA/Tae2 family protein
MYKNYFILQRLSNELNNLLTGSTCYESYSQEKNKLVFCFDKDKKEFFLEISVNPNFPYITLRNELHRAKKNTIDFFRKNLPGKLSSIAIAKFDRVIRLVFPAFNIYFIIRGKLTNVILIDTKNHIETFKEIDEQQKAEIVSSLNQLTFLPTAEINFEDKIINTISELKTSFPFLGKEILNELRARIKTENAGEIKKHFQNVINEIKSGTISLFINEKNRDIFLAPSTFVQFNDLTKTEYPSVTEALADYIKHKFTADKFIRNYKTIDNHLTFGMDSLSTKIENLRKRIEDGSKEDEYQQKANLLLININKIKKGLKEISLENIYDNNNIVKVQLKDDLTPHQNADYYFKKAKGEKINYVKSKTILEDSLKKYDKYFTIRQKFDKAVSNDELEEIMIELNLKKKEHINLIDELKNKFKHYVIDEKYHVYVGKDSVNNDLLTTRFAKQNDYWFHAKSVSGSHVVLRVENTKEVIPKPVLKKIASLAAYHSKAKTSGMVPVSYTFKKYVVKKKGMEAGKVTLLKEEVLIVQPEIPKGCEFITTD